MNGWCIWPQDMFKIRQKWVEKKCGSMRPSENKKYSGILAFHVLTYLRNAQSPSKRLRWNVQRLVHPRGRICRFQWEGKFCACPSFLGCSIRSSGGRNRNWWSHIWDRLFRPLPSGNRQEKGKNVNPWCRLRWKEEKPDAKFTLPPYALWILQSRHRIQVDPLWYRIWQMDYSRYACMHQSCWKLGSDGWNWC